MLTEDLYRSFSGFLLSFLLGRHWKELQRRMETVSKLPFPRAQDLPPPPAPGPVSSKMCVFLVLGQLNKKPL